MGNDIFWQGDEPSRDLQDRCTEFLRQFVLEADWEHEILKGRIKGNIIDRHTESTAEIERKGGIGAFFPHLKESSESTEQLGPLFQTEIELNGIRIFPMGKEKAIDNEISGHLSFVFNNSFYGHIYTIYDETLVTNEPFHDEYYKNKYGELYDPSLPIYRITPGGNTLALGEPLRLLFILELIRLRYVKNISLSCDYCISEETKSQIQQIIRDNIKTFNDEESFVKEAVSCISDLY